MTRLELGRFAATRAATHVDVGGLGLHSVAELAQSLSDPRLGSFLASSGSAGISLDLTGIGNLGAEHLHWVTQSWAPMLSPLGIKKLLVVVADEWHVRFGAQASAQLQEVTRFGIEPMCSSASQVGRRDVPIAWFDAPVAAGAQSGAAYRPAPHEPVHQASSGGVDLALPASATGFPVGVAAFFGFVVGGAVGAAWELAIMAMNARGVLDAGTIGGCAFAGLIGAPLLTMWVVKLRASPKSRVTWDERGLTEWLGDNARAFIAWPAARYAILETKVQVVRNGRATGPAQHQGYVMQISDGAGVTITLVEGARAPDWMHSRACAVPSLAPLKNLLPGTPQGRVTLDERAFTRAGFLGFGVVSWLAVAALVGGVLLIRQASQVSEQKLGALLIGLSGFLVLVRAIWPLRHLLSARKARAATASPLVELGLRALWALAVVIPAALIFTA